ncbi:S66 family peptidase [Polymorphospora rubra]|uniref:LD-carboxypeptidase n=1 Tax=Polymorphospora rubra TaxID=338584 RepID=A0A810MWS1_9ACTN|nr:LD-carboxypeptidase [Polymorphospora rubra]
MRYPAKPKPGDRVAVVSPSAGLPAIFPHVYELGLRRLRDEFGLTPVEYPTTRIMGASAADRARDLTAAFADPTITAVLATVGGDDQITVVPHLDDDVLRANPKPFFGYSDNTNLLNHLHRLGIVSYHGGSVLVHLGRPGALHPATADSLRAALFTSGWYDLTPADSWNDEPMDWADPANLDRDLPMFPGAGWHWQGPATVVEGPVWGGNLEIIHWLLAADRVGPTPWLGPPSGAAPNASGVPPVSGVSAGSGVSAASGGFPVSGVPAASGVSIEGGGILVVETSEELPSDVEVYRILRNLGERGLLANFPAVIVGRPKSWDFAKRRSAPEKQEYAAAQRAAVTRAVGEYNPDAVLVFDVDLGHTDPQLIIPYGGLARVDAAQRRISVRY